jgi:pimeloyl-ACP methyl ester carboxylesterase
LVEVYDNYDLISDALVDRMWNLSLREGNRQAFIDRVNISFADNTPKIKTINTPTLIIWGDKDEWNPVVCAEKFHQDLTNNQLSIIQKCGHLPMEERPVETAGLVRAFLR